MYLISKALDARRNNRTLFLDGEYHALRTSGQWADHALAFERRTVSGECAIVVVPRLVARVLGEEKMATGEPVGAVWGDTRIELPDDAASCWSPAFSDIFTGEAIRQERDGQGGRYLPVSRVLGSFPVALLFPGPGADE
jgi:maltooligosyltrehalose synthase